MNGGLVQRRGWISWWAAGLSLFGTSLSAITFMAIPAKTYRTDWGYFFFQMTPFMTAPILRSVYVPYFRRLNNRSAYEYLENRFNLLTRLLGSLSFMISKPDYHGSDQTMVQRYLITTDEQEARRSVWTPFPLHL